MLGKGVARKRFKVESLNLKGKFIAESSQPTAGKKDGDDAPSSWAGKCVGRDDRDEKDADTDNAETLSTGRGRVPKWDARSGWRPKFTVYVTAVCDDLSSYFLYSNDSNRMLVRRKLLIGLGMRGNWRSKMVLCARFA